MAGASIVINQSGLAAGSAGKSRRDLAIGTPVVLTNADNEGVYSWRWALIDRPTGSAAVISGGASATAGFTPDVAGGTWIIQLTVNAGADGEVQRRLAAVLSTFGGFSARGLRIPASGESDEANWNWDGGSIASPNARGWMPDFTELILYGGGSSSAGLLTHPVMTGSIAAVYDGINENTVTLTFGTGAVYTAAAPATKLKVVLPAIGVNDEGKRCGIMLRNGNVGQTMRIFADAADACGVPGGSIDAPGVHTTVAADTWTRPGGFTWQAVLDIDGLGTDGWIVVADTYGGEEPGLADVLATNPSTGANDIEIAGEQAIVYATLPAGVEALIYSTAHRLDEVAAAAAWTDIGGAVAIDPAAPTADTIVVVRGVFVARIDNGASTESAIIEEVWDVSTNVKLRAVLIDGSPNFRFDAVAGELFAQFLPPGGVDVQASVQVQVNLQLGAI